MPVLELTGPRAIAIEAGQVVSVLGAPGSGKTRLGLELAFLARPDDGEVLFHGSNPTAGRRRVQGKRPREVTMLVQNAEDQLFARTVFDDVAFGPRHLFLPQEEIERRVIESLWAVRLDAEAIKGRSPFALSGGERRRVALAGVLAMRPEVLILDEPTSNLDPQTRSDFLDLLGPLGRAAAVVWLTSSAVEAARAEKIYLLRGGRTSEVQAGRNLLSHWRELSAAGIELPAVFELAAALEDRCLTLPDIGSAEELEAAIVAGWKGSRV